MAPQSKKPDYSQERLRRVRTRLLSLKLDALITLEPTNLRWLTNWTEVFDEEPAHMALITQSKAYLHTDSRYAEAMMVKNKQKRWQVNAQAIGHFTFLQKTLSRMKKCDLRIGYESSIRLDLYKALKKAVASSSIKLVETKDVLAELRAIKDDEEIRLLQKAQKLTDAAFTDLLTWIRSGMTELEIANRLEYSLRAQGAQGISFPSIVASGPNAALPHARPTTRRLRKGDLIILDFGARYLDYCADMSRTLIAGEATPKQRALYDAVLCAQTKAKEGIRAGITAKQAYSLANDELKRQELDKAFVHSLGHGVGIDVHEQPALSPLNIKSLVAGNIVTVEPGVYLPGYGGIRIEDFGLVTESGFNNFTRSSLELMVIPVGAQ